MNNFVNVREILQSLAIDPSTATDPTRRMFIFDSERLSVNVATGAGAGSALHTQSAHDEIVVVLEGEAEFRVGDETKVVKVGDVVFIPQNTIHGRLRTISSTWVALSIYAPYFDRSKKNIQWA